MDPALEELLAGEAAEELEVVLKLRGAVAPPGLRVVARFGPVVTGRVARGRLRQVWAHPEVVSVKAPRLLALEDEVPLEAPPLALEPLPSDRRRPAELPETGRGVVIGVVDVGCDFAHPHFRRADGSTRLLAFWDQRPASAPAPSNRYGYGRIHTAAAINRALSSPDPYAALGYHPAAADPLGIGAHGTLVLDIAAGNGSLPGSPVGLAPEADLVFVQVATEALPGLANLGDSVRLLEALDFIRRAAGRRPWVGHLSLGRRGGPHDGLSLVEQALDHLLLEAPGRAVVLSCGNYFASGAHASGQIFNGRRQTFTWITDRADVTPNELEVWYPGRDVLRVELRPPAGGPVFRAALGENVPIVIAGQHVGHLYHRARDPNNGDNHIDIFLKPAAPAGSWQVTLSGEAVVDGRVHLWVERDAPCYRCDSRFPAAEADPFSTLGTICNGFYTVAVGAYDAHAPELRLAPFSSAGPTRDGRQKPDLLAPGVNILGARSAPPEGWGADLPRLTRQSGTSFAAPQVTGTIALMFEAAAQPLDIHTTRRLLLAHTCEPQLPPSERPRLGSGLLDVARAVAAAREGETAMTRPTITFQEPKAEAVPEARESWEEEDWPEREGAEALSLEADDNLLENGASFGQLYIGTATFDLTPTSPQPVQTSADLDQLLQYALAQVRPHAVITGNLLTAQEFRLFPWGGQSIPSPPPVVQVQSTQDLAAIIVNDGATAYFSSDPTTRTSRWVEIPRLPGFYALAPEDQNSQRQAWITRLWQVRNNLQVPGVTISPKWLNRRAMPALRLLLAHFAAQCFPVRPVDQPERRFRGGEVRGITLPLLSFPLREPDCYLPVIAQVEGRLESINAYDRGAGISLGPIQFNVIRGALFRFLGQLQQQDADLFQQELAGPLSWSLHPHGDHHDLIVRAGTPQEIRLHGSAIQSEVRRNYAYFQSGNPTQPEFAQINADWRRTVAGRFRNLVVWPHIQEIIMQVSSWWLGGGLQCIHSAGIPAIDHRNPEEETFILKALLLSAYVRFSASLTPFLAALARWFTVAEKLNHWQDALRDMCQITQNQKEQLLNRLQDQEGHAREVLAAIRRLAGAAAPAAPRPTEAVWPEEEPTPWEDVTAWEEAAGDLSDEEAFPAATAPVPSAVDLVELAAAALPAAGGLAPGVWLARILGEAGLVEGGQAGLAEALQPEHLFAALARGRRVPYNFPYANHFQVIGAPGQPLRIRLRPGDLLVRIAPGEFGLGHLAVIVSPYLIHRRDLAGHGLAGESHLPGWYVQVVEGGSFPHTRAHAFARRLLDAEGRLLPYQLLLRPESSGAVFRRTLAEAAAWEGVPTCQTEGTENYQVNWWDLQLDPGILEQTTPPELVALLRYLGVSYPTFAPHEGRYFQVLTEHLRRHGVLAATDSVDRNNFQQVIRDFQSRRGLGQDGLPGEDTLWHLQHDWAAGRNLTIVRVDADRYPGSHGDDHFRLREDAASACRALRQEVTGQGGIITSVGSLRELGAPVTASRSPTSMHYAGLALDLATDTGMSHPDRDPYLITQDGRKWRVWCRSAQAPEVTLDAVVWQNGRTSTQQVQARAFDFTALAHRHGFANIGPRRDFPTDYRSAEWWHFQYEAALTPFISQFGIELLSLERYTESTLQRHPNIWVHRLRIFKRQRHGWF